MAKIGTDWFYIYIAMIGTYLWYGTLYPHDNDMALYTQYPHGNDKALYSYMTMIRHSIPRWQWYGTLYLRDNDMALHVHMTIIDKIVQNMENIDIDLVPHHVHLLP